MNRKNFKKSFWLTAAVISASLIPDAHADDILPLEDSFLSDPPVVSQPAEQPAPQQAPLPDQPDAPAAISDPFAPEQQPAASVVNPFETPEPAPAPAPAPAPEPVLNLSAPTNNFGHPQQQQMTLTSSPADQFLGKLSSDVFREMAEIEQENNNLMLQLKRDKLRSEIDALKTSNRQALFNEIERREKMTQARLEWELEQDLKRQAAIERKQQAEIRQKQIEAALKREEERRIQREKDEELNRIKNEEVKKEQEKKRLQEEKKRQEALSLVQANKLKPTLMAVTRPVKPKRVPSVAALTQPSELGQDLLRQKKSGRDMSELSNRELNIQDVKPEEKKEVKKTTPIAKLYTLKGIHGIGGQLVVKLISNTPEPKTYYQKAGGKLPSGHVILKVSNDSIVVKKGDFPEETLTFSAAGLVGEPESPAAKPSVKQ